MVEPITSFGVSLVATAVFEAARTAVKQRRSRKNEAVERFLMAYDQEQFPALSSGRLQEVLCEPAHRAAMLTHDKSRTSLLLFDLLTPGHTPASSADMFSHLCEVFGSTAASSNELTSSATFTWARESVAGGDELKAGQAELYRLLTETTWAGDPPILYSDRVAALRAEHPTCKGRGKDLRKLRQAMTQAPLTLISGDPGSGKTNLMVHVVSHWKSLARAPLWKVSYFCQSSSASNTVDDFLYCVNSQLMIQLGKSGGVPVLRDRATRQLEELWTEICDLALQQGRIALFVVDGLDEESGGSEISLRLSQLPTHPAARVLATSRVSSLGTSGQSSIKTDPHHYELDRTEHSTVDAHKVRHQVQDVLESDVLAAQLLATSIAAAGPLTNADMSAILQTAPFEVRRCVAATAPLLKFVGGTDGAFRADHDYVIECIHELVGAESIVVGRQRVLDWANRYRARQWPRDTPDYLVQHFSNCLRQLDDVAERFEWLTLERFGRVFGSPIASAGLAGELRNLRQLLARGGPFSPHFAAFLASNSAFRSTAALPSGSWTDLTKAIGPSSTFAMWLAGQDSMGSEESLFAICREAPVEARAGLIRHAANPLLRIAGEPESSMALFSYSILRATGEGRSPLPADIRTELDDLQRNLGLDLDHERLAIARQVAWAGHSPAALLTDFELAALNGSTNLEHVADVTNLILAGLAVDRPRARHCAVEYISAELSHLDIHKNDPEVFGFAISEVVGLVAELWSAHERTDFVEQTLSRATSVSDPNDKLRTAASLGHLACMVDSTDLARRCLGAAMEMAEEALNLLTSPSDRSRAICSVLAASSQIVAEDNFDKALGWFGAHSFHAALDSLVGSSSLVALARAARWVDTESEFYNLALARLSAIDLDSGAGMLLGRLAFAAASEGDFDSIASRLESYLLRPIRMESQTYRMKVMSEYVFSLCDRGNQARAAKTASHFESQLRDSSLPRIVSDYCESRLLPVRTRLSPSDFDRHVKDLDGKDIDIIPSDWIQSLAIVDLDESLSQASNINQGSSWELYSLEALDRGLSLSHHDTCAGFLRDTATQFTGTSHAICIELSIRLSGPAALNEMTKLVDAHLSVD